MSSPVWGSGSNLVRTVYEPDWGVAASLPWALSTEGNYEAIFNLAAGFPGVDASKSLIESANIGRRIANEFSNSNIEGFYLDFNGSGGSEVRLVNYNSDEDLDNGSDWQVHFPFTVVVGYDNVIFNLMSINTTGSNQQNRQGEHLIVGGPLKDLSRTHLSIPATDRLEARNAGGNGIRTIEAFAPRLERLTHLDYRFYQQDDQSTYFNYIPLFLGEY